MGKTRKYRRNNRNTRRRGGGFFNRVKGFFSRKKVAPAPPPQNWKSNQSNRTKKLGFFSRLFSRKRIIEPSLQPVRTVAPATTAAPAAPVTTVAPVTTAALPEFNYNPEMLIPYNPNPRSMTARAPFNGSDCSRP